MDGHAALDRRRCCSAAASVDQYHGNVALTDGRQRQQRRQPLVLRVAAATQRRHCRSLLHYDEGGTAEKGRQRAKADGQLGGGLRLWLRLLAAAELCCDGCQSGPLRCDCEAVHEGERAALQPQYVEHELRLARVRGAEDVHVRSERAGLEEAAQHDTL